MIDAGDGRFSAVVLAASRGPDDPVARAAGVSHKCLARVAGVPLLLRVTAALRATPCIGRIAVVIEDESALVGAPEVAACLGDVMILPSAATPSLSVLAAAERLAEPWPLLVTTADHALLDREMVEFFCAAARRDGVDVAAGLASAAVVLAAQPHTQRTFIGFADGGYSGCNLFAILTPRGLEAVRFWAALEPHRKRPWRMARAFGLGTLLLFMTGRLTLDGALERLSRRLGLRAVAIRMPFGEAAIDVDKPADLALVETILSRRG